MLQMRRNLSSSLRKTYDYIVVGGGSSGCVLANSLSENGKNTVLLVEAGLPSEHYPWFHIPVGYLYTINNPRSDWCFKTSPEKYLGNRSLLYPRGLGLGGSSLINGMIYMRGQENDYNTWANMLNDPTWSWENLLPIFKSQENYYGGEDQWHGKDGRWNVEKVRSNWEILEAFIDGAEKYGIPRNDDFNTGDNSGVGYFDVNQRQGWRLNAYQAFITPRPNLSIISSSVVERLLFSSTNRLQCLGVSVHNGQSQSDFLAEREVILTAGAIGSVQILERSGIGKSNLLEPLGVKMVHELSGVGENLQDHLQLRLVYEIENAPTLNTRANSIFGKIGIALEYAMFRTGPMAAAPSQLGAFCRSSTRHETPNLQYHVQPLSLPAFGQSLDPFNGFTASVCDLRPTSVGSIHINSKSVDAAPLIQPNYLSTERDQRVAIEAIKITREITSLMDKRYNLRERKPGLGSLTEDELLQAAGGRIKPIVFHHNDSTDIGTTIFHPVGTCKMGLSSDEHAVVDSNLRVFGVKNLRVADCSIMPKITSGNTAAPAMLIGEKCARMILHNS